LQTFAQATQVCHKTGSAVCTHADYAAANDAAVKTAFPRCNFGTQSAPKYFWTADACTAGQVTTPLLAPAQMSCSHTGTSFSFLVACCQPVSPAPTPATAEPVPAPTAFPSAFPAVAATDAPSGAKTHKPSVPPPTMRPPPTRAKPPQGKPSPHKPPARPPTRKPTHEPTAQPTPLPQPHIIFMVADDLGWNDVGLTNARAYSPNINRLAGSGVQLMRHYTSRMCAPSRAAFFTSKMPWKIGYASDWNLTPVGNTRCATPDLSTPLLPALLKSAGYATHLIGKWHMGHYTSTKLPTSRGFETFVGYLSGEIDQSGGNMFADEMFVCDGGGVQRCNAWGHGAPGVTAQYSRAVVNMTASGAFTTLAPNWGPFADLFFGGEAARVIAQHPKDQPLFMYIGWASPHTPLSSPGTGYTGLINLPTTSQSSLAQACGATFVLRQRATLLAMVAAMDDAIGRVFSALVAAGLWQDTYLVFASDNGANGPIYTAGNNICTAGEWGSNYPLRGAKYTWWEGGVRTHAFVNSPRLASSGVQFSGLFSAVDWYPTMAGWAGAAVPTGIDGVDQGAAIDGAVAEARTSIVLQYWLETKRAVAITTMGGKLWKMIRGWPATGLFAGTDGPHQGATPQASIDQPPELPNAETNRSILSPPDTFSCNPACLFQITDDPSETKDLYPFKNTFADAVNALNTLINDAKNSAVLLAASGICAKGFVPGKVDLVTDPKSLQVALKLQHWAPWV